MHGLDEIIIVCPYCGESLDILIDTTDLHQYYQDCQVCCAPILFIVSEDENGELVIDVKRDDE